MLNTACLTWALIYLDAHERCANWVWEFPLIYVVAVYSISSGTREYHYIHLNTLYAVLLGRLCIPWHSFGIKQCKLLKLIPSKQTAQLCFRCCSFMYTGYVFQCHSASRNFAWNGTRQAIIGYIDNYHKYVHLWYLWGFSGTTDHPIRSDHIIFKRAGAILQNPAALRLLTNIVRILISGEVPLPYGAKVSDKLGFFLWWL